MTAGGWRAPTPHQDRFRAGRATATLGRRKMLCPISRTVSSASGSPPHRDRISAHAATRKYRAGGGAVPTAGDGIRVIRDVPSHPPLTGESRSANGPFPGHPDSDDNRQAETPSHLSPRIFGCDGGLRTGHCSNRGSTRDLSGAGLHCGAGPRGFYFPLHPSWIFLN